MIVILMFFALILFGILGYTIFQQLSYMPELIQQNQQQVAEARADELSKELKGIEDIVEVAANSPTVQSMDMEEIREYLPHLMISDKIRNMTVSDAQGNAWTTYDAFIDISDQEQFERIFIYDESHVLSEPFHSPYIEEDVPIMTIAYSVHNGSREKVGLVNAVVSMAFIEDLLAGIKTEESCYAYIIDQEGMVVSHPSEEIGLADHISRWMPEEAHQMEVLDKDGGSLEYTDPDGEKYLGVYTEIEGRPGWKMVMSVSADVAYAEYYAIIEYILGMLLFGILLITIFAYFYADTLAKPVLALKSVFESAAEGNLSVEAEEDYPNEFGKTGAAFNTMLNQIKQLTFRDPVTDLYNQNSFVVELRQMFKKKHRPGNHYLLLVSIDDFKRIDSIGGQGSGDQALQVVAGRLNNFIKKEELIGRYYGDEMILYLQSQSKKDFTKRLQRLRDIYDYPIYLKGVQYRLKTSIGITAINHPTTELQEEIKEVTVAKQKVKRSGGNGFEFYNKRFKEEILEEQQMEEALFYAIAKNELYLVYQPILSVAGDTVIGHEALLRWKNPVYGRVSVPRIIDLAEKSGLIFELGEWTLTEACRQNQQWIEQGYGSLIMAVNFSALQMADSKILETVSESLKESQMDPKLLNIEITETVAMIHTDQKVELMTALKKIGVTFSIDDFGTGYSSLSYFTNFPVDTLKIDRSFIQNMLIDENARTVTTTIIQMAKALNLRIIAEGVETREHLEALKELDCSHYQGYLVSKPRLPKRCEEIMEKYR
ncbi:EAL domain-containing protein [Isachenkonia alkalipeptolytica]|uniref:EAL domain-containing protein n=2 Tax=Isachenkonia alkalipeptolytica TaxID=2565777 RepID=A0AA43XL52_9CLOT|nr:EAL domain-containing protein [Isachenkonia alkalipeptolytica]